MNNDINQSIGYVVGMTRRFIIKSLNDAFIKNNIPLTIEQFVFLRTLKNQPGEVTQQDMASLTNKDKSAILRTLDILEKKGLVERLNTPGDRRKNSLRITKSCEGLFEEIEKIEQKTMSALTVGIDKEDYQVMVKGLLQIQENAKNIKY